MSSSPAKKFLLPAVLVSISVFVLIMAAFTTIRPPTAIARERSADADAPTPEWILPSERDRSRIRQVGVAFIMSVSAGILVVEGLRRWYAFQESGQTKARQLGLEEFLLEEPSLPEDS